MACAAVLPSMLLKESVGLKAGKFLVARFFMLTGADQSTDRSSDGQPT